MVQADACTKCERFEWLQPSKAREKALSLTYVRFFLGFGIIIDDFLYSLELISDAMTEKKRKISKEVREWIILISVFAFLYFTGLHTVVIGTLQRGLLATGIMQPSLEQDLKVASYDLILEDLDGNQVSMETLKGKTIFMNLWATWCAPCVAEMPDINSLYGKVNTDVAFVMLSRDEDEAKAREWIQRKGYAFPVYFQRSAMPRQYQTGSIPTTFVISPEGNITVTRSGMAKYDTEVFRNYLTSLATGLQELDPS